MTDINAAPDFLIRPIFQDPDARLLDLARWHEAMIRLVSANTYAQDLAHKAGDRAALTAAEAEQHALWDDWRMVIYEAEALAPRTLQGFALKIRIFAEKHEEWWHEPGLADDEACARAILQQVLAAAGVAPPGRSTWDRFSDMVDGLPEDHKPDLEPIRLMIAATLDYLQDLSGKQGSDLGRAFTGPKSTLG